MSDSAGPTPAFTARLHGSAQLLTAAGARVALERKQALLLAYLSIEGPTPRGKIARLLWPDAPEARARGNLRQRLAVLRQSAGIDLVRDDAGVLSLAPVLEVAPSPANGADLLANFEYDDCDAGAQWLDGQRESERARQRAALLLAIRAAVQAGQLDDALRLADSLLALDRESEEAYRAQMEVLYLRGDTAAAIAVWDRCKEMLRQLYGVTPSATTRQLGETILAAAASAVPAPAVAADAIPVTVLRPPRLVGRGALVQRLLDAWRSGRTPWVSGEAGLGKSRLLAEFALAVGPCASASARPGDANVPYASLERLVLAAIDRFEPSLDGDHLRDAARLLPRVAALRAGEVPAPVHTDYERRQCLRAVAQLLADCGARGCQALLLDDLQFADAASVEAAIEIARSNDSSKGGDKDSRKSGANAPRFIFATRPDEPASHQVAWWASLADHERFPRIELQPLDADGVAELIGTLGLKALDANALARRLWRQVGGNPAFVLESIKLVLALGGQAAIGQGSMPLAPDIVAVIERRIGLLSTQARHLAQLAAIAGESYSVPLAAAALACAPLALSEPLRELELRQVLYGRQFVHDVIAVAVNRSIPQSVAEFMHRFVADYLEQHGGEPARVAVHWQACAEWRRAGDAFRAAATAAGEASRPIEQSQLLDEAAACFERCDAVDALFDALEARQTVFSAPDANTARLTCMQRMEALAHTEDQRLRALLCREGWKADRAQTDATDVGLAAIERATALGAHRIALEFARVTAWRLSMAGDETLALQTLESQREWTMTQGTRADQIEFRCAMSGVLGFVDRLGAAAEEARHGIAELRATGNWVRLLPVLSNLGLLLHWRGELADARAALEEAARLRDRMHGRGSALVIDLNLAAVHRDLGEFETAERMLMDCVTELRGRVDAGADLSARSDAAIGENHLGQLWLSLGQPERALDWLAGDDLGVSTRFRARRLALRLRAARMQGRSDAALLAQTQALRDAIDSPFHRSLLDLELACVLPPAQAMPVYVDALTQRGTLERPGLQLHAAVRAAQAALALGDAALAQRHLAPVQAMLRDGAPLDIERAEVWTIAAEVADANGDAAAAHALRDHGRAWLRASAVSGVAPAWRDAYLRRQPANVALLSGA